MWLRSIQALVQHMNILQPLSGDEGKVAVALRLHGSTADAMACGQTLFV
jgi:hypothetical protein